MASWLVNVADLAGKSEGAFHWCAPLTLSSSATISSIDHSFLVRPAAIAGVHLRLEWILTKL